METESAEMSRNQNIEVLIHCAKEFILSLICSREV